MNKARESLSSFLSRNGKHDTTVHEVRTMLSNGVCPS